MADGYDRFDNEGGGGGSFVMGLLTGTVLGAGLGMLFAPKAGSELRGQLSEQADKMANTASEGYRRASETAGGGPTRAAKRDAEIYDKARDAVSRGNEEARTLRRGKRAIRSRRRAIPISKGSGDSSTSYASGAPSSGVTGGMQEAST